jgi:hypothetical protein
MAKLGRQRSEISGIRAERNSGMFHTKSLYRDKPSLITIKRYFRVNPEAIGLMRFTLEGYEGIAGITTLNASAGLIVINIAPGCEPDVQMVLQDLQKQVYMEEVRSEALKG